MASQVLSSPNSRPSFFVRSLARWGALSVIFGLFFTIYNTHPYYAGKQFTVWRQVLKGDVLSLWGQSVHLPGLYAAWFVFGLPYVMLTLWHFGKHPKTGTRIDRQDTGLMILVLFHQLVRRFYEKKPALPIWQTSRLRNLCLGILVKAFYLPLMVVFFNDHMFALKNIISWFWKLEAFSFGSFDVQDHGLNLFYNLAFAVDCGVALVGYGLECKWLNNKTKSVEPTMFGWMVALFCYPPFNPVLGTYFPMNGPDVGFSPNTKLVFRAIVVFLFFIYASATVAFGARFSNLTNRGIITRGPYRFVRHPAYICKSLAWWFEQMPTMNVGTALSMIGVNIWYGLRAYTEERHLSQDPDYVAYKKKVRWMFVPGVF